VRIDKTQCALKKLSAHYGKIMRIIIGMRISRIYMYKYIQSNFTEHTVWYYIQNVLLAYSRTQTFYWHAYSRTHTFYWHTHVHILFTGILTYTYFLLTYSRTQTFYWHTHVHILFTRILTYTYFLLVYSRTHTFYWYTHTCTHIGYVGMWYR
jgi:hypothetical protein